MIIKSMSRKEPSFGQLVAYMSDEKSDRAFDLHHHVFTRDPGDIAAEFEDNARLLGKRKGGNYLFHEILSLDTRECGQGREVKEKLRLLAFEYIERRCARNMVYGAMHRDHEGHLHYHLMISANERGNRSRLRFSPGQFDSTKREMERHSRQKYPELKQPEVMDQSPEDRDKRRDQRKSQKQQEMEKRGAKLTKKEQLSQELSGMMVYAKSQAEFERLLKDHGFTLRQNGKNWVIDPIAREGETKRIKGHRFSTLGVHAEYEAFLDRVELVIEEERVAGEKEKTGQAAEDREGPEQAAPERDGPEADNEPYVKYDSKADAKSEPTSQQNPEASQERDLHDEELKRESELSNREDQDMSREREDGLKKPSLERQELIDKGHVQPDPDRDLMSHEDWKSQDKFTTKVQQSWRRTMDDFRGRTKDFEDRVRGKSDDDGERER